ncbi:hypothetical protein ABPG72_000331 [Tetrahymena utriculariae]
MGKNTAVIIKIINIGLALLLVGLSIYHIILLQPFSEITTLKFFNFFTPFFLILLGAMLIAGEMKAEFVTKYFKFLQNFLGRGVFNIYLATIAVYIYESNDVLGFVFGSIMFGFGIFYIILHFCKPKDLGYDNEYSSASV